MSEAKINVATGFNGGVSVSLRADNAAELLSLQEELRAAAAKDPALARAFKDLIGGAAHQTIEGAANVIQAAFPQASTVGQPLPTVAQPAQGNPPGLASPGNCAHGPRVYKDTVARGKQWRRWECSIPWSRDAQGRCQPVNAES